MYIPIFLEVDSQGECLYGQEFKNLICVTKIEKKPVIVSKEYYDLADDEAKEYCWKIPDEFIDIIDSDITDRKDRQTILTIQKNSSISDWAFGKLSTVVDDLKGIFLLGQYNSFIEAAKKLQVEVYFKIDAIDNMSMTIDDISGKLDDYNEKNRRLLLENSELNSSIRGKDEYIQQLQLKVNELNMELTKQNQRLQDNNEEMLANMERLEKSEERKFLYLKMYTALLDELDKIKVQILEKQIGKK